MSAAQVFARRGWLACCVAAYIVVVVLAADGGVFHGARVQPSSAGAFGFVVGVLFALAVPAGVIGSVVGVPLQRLARPRYCAEPLGPEPRPASVARVQPLIDPVWSERHRRCRVAADRFHRVADAVPPGPGRVWLEDLAEAVEGHVTAAARVARQGQELRPGAPLDSTSVDPAADRCARRLDATATALEELADQAARAAVMLTPEPDLDALRCQLELLVAEAPLLCPPSDPVGPREGGRQQLDPRRTPASRGRRRTPWCPAGSFRDCAPIIGTGAVGILGAGAAWTVPEAPTTTLQLLCLSLLVVFVPMLLGGTALWLSGPEVTGRRTRWMWPVAIVAGAALLVAASVTGGIVPAVLLLVALLVPWVLAAGAGAGASLRRAPRRR